MPNFADIFKDFNYTKKKKDTRPVVDSHDAVPESSSTAIEDTLCSSTDVNTNSYPNSIPKIPASYTNEI